MEQVGGVIAGLPSLQVSLFRNGVGGIRIYGVLPSLIFIFFCWLPKIALEYVFTLLYFAIYAVRMAAAVTTPLQTSAWTPEVPPTLCPSHTLQGVNQNLISDF